MIQLVTLNYLNTPPHSPTVKKDGLTTPPGSPPTNPLSSKNCLTTWFSMFLHRFFY